MNPSSSLLIAFAVMLTALSAGDVQAAGPTRALAKTFKRLHAELKAEAEQELEAEKERPDSNSEDAVADSEGKRDSDMEVATFGNGCFWCTEAVFEELHGVEAVMSGYSGGRLANPTYKQVCTGVTGHAEVIHLRFNPREISYATLLEVFWRTHDPTTKNRQGPDFGTQYRSAVFFHSDEQRDLAIRFKNELNEAHAFRKPIVTEITKFEKFFPAENYHQDYFKLNGRAPYCRQMIKPKLTKFRRIFADELAKKKQASKSPVETKVAN